MSLKKILDEIAAEEQLGVQVDQPIEKEKTTKVTLQDALNNFTWKFQTHGDKILIAMLREAKGYLEHLHKKEYRSFCLVGPTEAGKTTLNQDIKRFILKHPEYFPFKIVEQRDEYLIYDTLSGLTSKLLDSPKYLKTLERCGILFIEEFLGFRVKNNYTEIQIEKAFEILTARAGRSTVLDTNKSLEDIQEIDIRIKSRLYRNDGIVIEIPPTITPYLSRR